MKVHVSSIGSRAVSQEAARKLRRREMERQEFEEERMIRLPVWPTSTPFIYISSNNSVCKAYRIFVLSSALLYP